MHILGQASVPFYICIKGANALDAWLGRGALYMKFAKNIRPAKVDLYVILN